MRDFFRKLAYRIGLTKPDILVCVREEDCLVWSDDLDKKTKGQCFHCKDAIFYEEKNRDFLIKICSSCHSPLWKIFKELNA